MVAITHPFEVCLPPRGLCRIPDVSGVRIACREGAVWITIDDDPRDIVLEPGQAFTGEAHRRALVSAFTSSQVTVSSAEAAAFAAPALAFCG